MADRPRGNGGPEKGTPEYDWLYGSRRGGNADDATRAVPRDGRADDRTRMIPTQERPGDGHRSDKPPTRPAPPPVAPAPGGGRGRRMPRFRLRWLKIALLLWLVFLIAVPFWAWTKVASVDAFPADDGRPDDQPGTTYLIVGNDKADDLSDEQREAIRPGERTANLTDTIMLLHIGSGPNLLMSIPRDSIVDMPGHGSSKINAAVGRGGPKLLVQTVEANTGIRVDNYIEMGFGGVINLVDAVGGIEICPTSRMQDEDARLDIEKGCQDVDGATALAYARSRKTTGLGDIDRARHQREVVSGVGRKALSPWSAINPVRWYRLNTAGASSIAVSEGTGPIDMARFAWAITRVNGDNGLTCGVPINDLAVNWDPERSERLFARIIEDNTKGIGKNLCTPTGMLP